MLGYSFKLEVDLSRTTVTFGMMVRHEWLLAPAVYEDAGVGVRGASLPSASTGISAGCILLAARCMRGLHSKASWKCINMDFLPLWLCLSRTMHLLAVRLRLPFRWQWGHEVVIQMVLLASWACFGRGRWGGRALRGSPLRRGIED